jgi:hypothetical protein
VDGEKIIHLDASQSKQIRQEIPGLNDDEEVVHLTAFQAHHIRGELLILRQRLLDEQSEDSERLSRLRDLIDALNAPQRPPA